MSTVAEERAADEVCANCGKSAVDDIQLKICTACKLVKYCSVECQKNHRKQHKKACKKRAAELRDDRLFTQPEESYLGECPICCLPLSFDTSKSVISCCCKRICNGCDYANQKREVEQGQYPKCAYCREPMPASQEEIDQNYMERAKANDPVALFEMGHKCDDERDFEGAVEYYTKVAALGDMDAHYNLSNMYYKGKGVEKDMKKYLHHLEEAAIGGHPGARYNLGCAEWNSGRYERAMKHYIIAANLGDDEALDRVKQGFVDGIVNKEGYASALRGHQTAVDESKSTQREEAEKAKREGSYHTL